MSEYRRKTLRSFYCEEALWKSYEKLAKERDTTIDQLLSDALQAFLDGGQPAAAPPAAAPPPAPSAPAAPVAVAPAPPAAAPAPPAVVPAPVAPPAPRPQAPSLASGPASVGDRVTMERMAPVRAPAAAPPPPPARPPAPPPAPPQAAGGGMPKLFLHYGGRAHPVATERFVIGRGSKGTDLTIRDGNISRKHAVVIFHNGSFFVQDLGSTNGVEFNGQRVDTKAIEEGDVFSICDHEITFSYRG